MGVFCKLVFSFVIPGYPVICASACSTDAVRDSQRHSVSTVLTCSLSASWGPLKTLCPTFAPASNFSSMVPARCLVALFLSFLCNFFLFWKAHPSAYYRVNSNDPKSYIYCGHDRCSLYKFSKMRSKQLPRSQEGIWSNFCLWPQAVSSTCLNLACWSDIVLKWRVIQ